MNPMPLKSLCHEKVGSASHAVPELTSLYQKCRNRVRGQIEQQRALGVDKAVASEFRHFVKGPIATPTSCTHCDRHIAICEYCCPDFPRFADCSLASSRRIR
jgi:hypothetical protein